MTSRRSIASGHGAEAVRGVLERAARDPAFRATLVAAPSACLREHGVAVPAGVRVRVVDPPPGIDCLVLPSAPVVGEALSDSELAAASAGGAEATALAGHSDWAFSLPSRGPSNYPRPFPLFGRAG